MITTINSREQIKTCVTQENKLKQQLQHQRINMKAMLKHWRTKIKTLVQHLENKNSHENTT